jgi:hypothetical protein
MLFPGIYILKFRDLAPFFFYNFNKFPSQIDDFLELLLNMISHNIIGCMHKILISMQPA